VKVAIAMYASYAILFSNFYYWTYIRNKPKGASITSGKKDKILAKANGVLPQNGYIKHRTVKY